MLTSADETDLLIPLFGGGGDGHARFAPFLARLLRRTRADHAALVCDQETFAAGAPMAALASHLHTAALRPGRVYALSELAGAGDGPGDARILRLAVAEPAWLLITRTEECTAADAALLSALGPYVAIALRQFQAEQRAQMLETAAAAALERAGTGWLLLDAEGRVTDLGPGLAQRLEAAGVRLRTGDRLPGLGAPPADQAPRAILLGAEPRIEVLLLPASGAGAALMALCRFPRTAGERADRLFAQLSGLPPREAEFAVALARGRSIAEAGAALGLTLETARSYSKQIYAKLGLRGQAELVRRFYESGASLA